MPIREANRVCTYFGWLRPGTSNIEVHLGELLYVNIQMRGKRTWNIRANTETAFLKYMRR